MRWDVNEQVKSETPFTKVFSVYDVMRQDAANYKLPFLQAGGHQFESDKLHHVRDAANAPYLKGAFALYPQVNRSRFFQSLPGK